MALKWNGAKVSAAVKRAGITGLQDGADFILGKSKEIVPHEWGALSRSGIVTIAGDYVYISYSTPYAIIQHEALGFRHPNPRSDKSSSGRSAKYLERPFNEYKQKAIKLAAERMSAAIKGG